ncbi:MAG: glucosaminidase domain-containing protein, partial [Bacteroidia bacterium]|nr:glucosaminidase domain-containing protein [Bacteroidia bacterium]
MNYKLTALILLGALALQSCKSKKVISAKNSTKKEHVIRTQQTPKTDEVVVVEKEVEPAPRNLSYAEVVSNYIDDYSTIAKDEMLQYGIPASITLAQAILESGAGNGELTRKANNHFGIKCHTGWTGERVYHDDDEKGECFRKY